MQSETVEQKMARLKGLIAIEDACARPMPSFRECALNRASFRAASVRSPVPASLTLSVILTPGPYDKAAPKRGA